MFYDQKPNYGIDAPPVILGFLFLGVLGIGISLAFSYFSFWSSSVFSSILFGCALLTGVYCLISAVLMIYSSKKGKVHLIRQLVNQLEWKGDEIVLDVGCGRGIFLNEVAKKLVSGKVIGIDIWENKNQSGNFLNSTFENAQLEGIPRERIEVMTADMRMMPFIDAAFDIVVSSLAIHSIKNPQERIKSIQEMARVLRPGGRLILLDSAYIDQHLETLERLGWEQVAKSDLRYHLFPPVRIIWGTKPHD